MPWTPAPGGTLHRCIRVTLKQPNYRDDHSQRNINIVRALPGRFGQIRIPARIKNPDGISHTLQLQTHLLGIDPSWQPDIRLDDGSPLPSEIGPGQTLGFLIGLLLPAQNMPAQNAEVAAADDPRVGDASSIQVNVLFDGASAGGFTVEFAPPLKVSLPLLVKAQ